MQDYVLVGSSDLLKSPFFTSTVSTGLNKQDAMCYLTSFRSSGRQIVLPVDRARLEVSPVFQMFC